MNMKKFLLLTCMMFSMASYAQDTLSVPINDAERIVDKYVDQVSTAINDLALALKVPADHVYGVLVKQQGIKASSALIYPGFFLLAILLFILSGRYFHTKHWELFDKSEEEEPDEWDAEKSFAGVAQIISCVLAVVMLILFLISIEPLVIIQGFFNPEYGAIQDISNMIR